MLYAKSSFDIAVPTGLALESIFDPTHDRIDPEREIPAIDMRKYKRVFINVYTVLRNILDSSPKEAVTKSWLSPFDIFNISSGVSSDVLDIIRDEFEKISNLFAGRSIELIYYKPDYNILKRTSGDLNTRDIGKMVFMDRILKNGNVVGYLEVPAIFRVMDHTLMFTHIAFDLVNKNIDVLRSTTGSLVTSKEYYKFLKRYGQNDMSCIPFSELTLIIFGDNKMYNSKTFLSHDKKEGALKNRKIIYEAICKLRKSGAKVRVSDFYKELPEWLVKSIRDIKLQSTRSSVL